jgi:hypothetical protein
MVFFAMSGRKAMTPIAAVEPVKTGFQAEQNLPIFLPIPAFVAPVSRG